MLLTETKQGYKKTKLGWIPEDWDAPKFKELYSNPIRDFGSFSSTKLITFLDSGVVFLKSEMIDYGKIHWDNIFYISDEVHQKLNKSIVYPGQILFSKIGSALGKAVVYEGEQGVCNSNAAIAKISINESIADKYYITYILNHSISKRQFKRRIISLLPRLNLGDINSLYITLPPLPEQKKIAQILSTWDKAIEKTKQLIEQKKLLKKGLMQQFFTGKVRFEEFKQEEWKSIRAGEIFGNYSNKKHDGEFQVLSATQDRGVIPRDQLDINIKYDPNSLKNYKIVEVGCFIISLRSFQGGIEYSEHKGLISPAYTVLKEKQPIATSFYKCTSPLNTQTNFTDKKCKLVL